jgi:hypothetical protein
MSVRLYEITADMRELVAMLDQDGIGLDDIADTMEALELDFNDKVENSVKLIKSLQYDSLACKTESGRLADRSKRIDSRVKWLTDYVSQQMIGAGRPKLMLPEFTTTVRTAVRTVFFTNEESIPDHYKTIIKAVKIDKKAIKLDLENDVTVPGAELQAGKTWLDIR